MGPKCEWMKHGWREELGHRVHSVDRDDSLVENVFGGGRVGSERGGEPSRIGLDFGQIASHRINLQLLAGNRTQISITAAPPALHLALTSSCVSSSLSL